VKSRLAMLGIVLCLVFLAMWVAPLRSSPAMSAASRRIYLPLLTRSSGPPPAECTLAPQLIAPVNGSTLDTLLPRFEWDSGDDPSATEFWLQVCFDHACTDFEYRARSSNWAHGRWEHRPVLNLQPATTFYWRAYLTCGQVRGPYSAVWSFTTGSGGEILSGPHLISPADGSTVPGWEVNVEWSALAGAEEYQLNYTDGELHAATFTTDVCWVLDDLQADTEYEWWVVARNDYAWGEESEHWRFSTGQ
jgi:hypothetical protein